MTVSNSTQTLAAIDKKGTFLIASYSYIHKVIISVKAIYAEIMNKF